MTPQQIFTQDLRRILYLSQILKWNVAAIKALPNCPSYLKADLNNLNNCIFRLFRQISISAKNPADWGKILVDLNNEDAKDISLMLDFCAGITNVGELVNVLEEHVKVSNEKTIPNGI